MSRDGIQVRPCADLAEYADAMDAIGQYFGNEPDRGADASVSRTCCRSIACTRRWEDGRSSAARARSRSRCRCPAARCRAAATTVVGVAPTHRRRGVLRAMMRAHLDDVHERGEPIAALWASEETIYGRFGYGLAPRYAGEVNAPARVRRRSRSRSSARGTVRLVEPDEAAKTFPPLWDGLARERPGMFIAHAGRGGSRARFDDPASVAAARARSASRSSSSTARPPATRSTAHKMDWEDGSTEGKVIVIEAIAPTPEARAELWRYLLDIDWTSRRSRAASCRRPPAVLVARRAAADAVPRRRRRCGCASSTSAPRCPARGYASDGELVLRGARRVLPVERGPLAARRTGRRARTTTADLAPRRHGARLGVPRRLQLRAARAGRPRRGAEGRRDRRAADLFRDGLASVVPRDLLAGLRTLPVPSPRRRLRVTLRRRVFTACAHRVHRVCREYDAGRASARSSRRRRRRARRGTLLC